MPLIYCKSCGKLIQNTEKTCPLCGATVEFLKPRRTTTVKTEPVKVVTQVEPPQTAPQQPTPAPAQPVQAEPTDEQLLRRLAEAQKRLGELQAELDSIPFPEPVEEPRTIDEPAPEPEPVKEPIPHTEPMAVKENDRCGNTTETQPSSDISAPKAPEPTTEDEHSLADLRDHLLKPSPADKVRTEEVVNVEENVDVDEENSDEEDYTPKDIQEDTFDDEDDSEDEERSKGGWILPVVIVLLLAVLGVAGYYMYMQSPLHYSHVADKYIAALPEECTVLGERIDREVKKIYYCENITQDPTIYVYYLDSKKGRQLLYAGADIDGFVIDNYAIADYRMTNDRMFISTHRTENNRKWNADVFYIQTTDDEIHYVDHGSSAEFTDNGEVNINHVIALHDGKSAAVTGYEERPVNYSLTATDRQLSQQREEEKMQDIILEKQRREEAGRNPKASQPAPSEPTSTTTTQPRQSSIPKGQTVTTPSTKENSLFEYLNGTQRGSNPTAAPQNNKPSKGQKAVTSGKKENSLFEFLNGTQGGNSHNAAPRNNTSTQNTSAPRNNASTQNSSTPKSTATTQNHGYDPRYAAPATSATQEATSGSDAGQSFLLAEQIQRSINELNQLESLDHLTPQQQTRVQQLKHNILSGYESMATLGKNIGNKSLYDYAVASKARMERELSKLKY